MIVILVAPVLTVGYAALSDDVGDLAPVLCVSGEGAGTELADGVAKVLALGAS